MITTNQLTKNFFLSEFACHDGTPVPVELHNNILNLAIQLQILRDQIAVPININSGYRTKEYNDKVGGARESQHLLAKAADITTRSLSPKVLAGIIEQMITEKKLFFGGIGLYPSWVHVDIRTKRARW